MEPLVGTAQSFLRDFGLPRQHLNERLVVGDPLRVDPADLLDDRVALADERSSGFELATHGTEHRKRVECLSHGHGAAPNLLPDLQAPFNRFVHRRRPDDGRRGTPVEDLEQLPCLARPSRVLCAAPPRLVRLRGLPDDPRAERLQRPGPDLAEIVAAFLEHLESAVGDPRHVVDGGSVRLQQHELLLDLGACLEELVRGEFDCLGQDTIGVSQLSGFEQRSTKSGEEVKPGGILPGEQRGGALEQAGCRRRVSAQEGLSCSGLEPGLCLLRKRPLVVAHEPEPVAAPASLLEVKADDLVLAVLGAREPVREAFVELRAQLLRQPVVGRLLDEHVAEAEGVLAGEGRRVRLDQLPAHQGHQMLAELGALAQGEERSDRARLEVAALDRGVLEHGPLAGFQARDTGGQDGLDARRQLAFAALGLGGHELLEEKRVALGRLDDPPRVHLQEAPRSEGVD